MWANQLYAFMVTYLLKGQKSLINPAAYPQLTQIQQRHSTAYNLGYCVLNLSLAGVPNCYGDYWLVGHHVSVFERFDPKMPVLSECHYTGYFVDDNNTHYQLHIYFDAEGNLLRKPLFQSAQQNEILPPFLAQQFITLATQQTQPLLSKLYAEIEQVMTQLTLEYQLLDDQCKTLNSENLQKLSQQLDKMIMLSKAKTFSLHTSRKKLITLLLQELQTPPPASTTTPVTINSDTPDAPVSAPRISLPAPAVPTINLEVEGFKSAYRSYLTETTPAKKAQKINLLLQDIYAEQFSAQLPLKTLQELYTLERLALKEGTQLFAQVIENKKFEIAKMLSCFHDQLSLKHLESALQHKDPTYLQFLLEKGHYNLDTQALMINGVPYPSAVAYCVSQSQNGKNTPATTANIALCFQHLLKNGIDLYALNAAGMPIAHVLLSDLKHPLHDTLMTFIAPNKSVFFNKLKKVILNLLSSASTPRLPESPNMTEEAVVPEAALIDFPAELSALTKPAALIAPSALTLEAKQSLETALTSYLSECAVNRAANVQIMCATPEGQRALAQALESEYATPLNADVDANPEIQALLKENAALNNMLLKALPRSNQIKNGKNTLETIQKISLLKSCLGEHWLQNTPLEKRYNDRKKFLEHEREILKLHLQKTTLLKNIKTSKVQIDPTSKLGKKLLKIDAALAAIKAEYEATKTPVPRLPEAPVASAPVYDAIPVLPKKQKQEFDRAMAVITSEYKALVTPAPSPSKDTAPVLSKKKQKELDRVNAQLEKQRTTDQKTYLKTHVEIKEMKQKGILNTILHMLAVLKVGMTHPFTPEHAAQGTLGLFPEGLPAAEKPLLFSWIQQNHPRGLPPFEATYLECCNINVKALGPKP